MQCCDCGGLKPVAATGSPGGALPAGVSDANILVFDAASGLWVAGSFSRVYEWGALNAGNAAGVARYLQHAGSSVAAGTTESVSQREMQFSGRIRKLRIVLFVASATNITYTLRINQVDTAFVVTLLAGQIVGEIAGDLATLAGDLLSVRSISVAADAAQTGIKAYVLVDTP
jgi:hypothetical protein